MELGHGPRGARRSRRGAALIYAAFGALLAGGLVATTLSLSLSAKKTADARREHGDEGERASGRGEQADPVLADEDRVRRDRAAR